MFSPEEIRNYITEFDTIHEKIKSAGDEWAESKQLADRYHDLKKTMLAKAQNKIASTGQQISEAKLLRLALDDPDFISWVDMSCELNAKAMKLHVKFTAYKDRFEALRTIISVAKQSMAMV